MPEGTHWSHDFAPNKQQVNVEKAHLRADLIYSFLEYRRFIRRRLVRGA